MWRRWIYDDYYRSYLVPLEKYGLVIPHDLIEESWNQIWNKGYVHEVAQFFATGWLANYWRIDPMTDKDFEWFEYKYPGWYDKYGKWWENYNRLSTPNGHHPIVFEDVDYQYPHRCWTCMVPCLVREDMVMAEVDGQWRTYCHEACRWTDVEAFRPTYQGRETPNMGQLIGAPRVGDALPRLELGRRGLGHGLRPRRRQDAGGAAAPRPRPEEDVDARPPAPVPAVAEPERAAERDDGQRTRDGVPRARYSSAGRARALRRVRRPGHPRSQKDRRRDHGQTSTSCGSSPSASRSRSTRSRRSCASAAEQGIMLMHGCKEGQCAACKSFVLDGDDIELDRYSTFALPDYEKEEGYTLLCRAHVYEDVTIELLNYDEEMIRSGLPIQKAVAEVVSNEHVTHDMRHLVLRLVEPASSRSSPASTSTSRSRAPRRPGRSRWRTRPAARAGGSSS